MQMDSELRGRVAPALALKILLKNNPKLALPVQETAGLKLTVATEKVQGLPEKSQMRSCLRIKSKKMAVAVTQHTQDLGNNLYFLQNREKTEKELL